MITSPEFLQNKNNVGNRSRGMKKIKIIFILIKKH